MILNNSVQCQEAVVFYLPPSLDDSQLPAGLTEQGLQVFAVNDVAGLLACLHSESPDSVLIDLRQDPDAAIAVVRSVREVNPDIGVVVISSLLSMEHARAALQAGADDFLVEGLEADLVAATLRLVGCTYRLRLENRNFANARQVDLAEPSLSGCSPIIRRLQAAIERAADNDATILIEGMPGTGKTLVAGMVHGKASHQDRGYVVLSCEGLNESVLTTALASGREETLLLEDIDCLPATVQSALVKFLKEKQETERTAGSGSVRIIATTAARLAELTARGAFREDLYYRLNVFPLAIPSLKERKEDIALLAADLLSQSAIANSLDDRGFTPSAMILLETHPWPGNISQLKGTILRAHALAAGGPIDRVHLLGPVTGITVPPGVAGLSDVVHIEPREVCESDILPFEEEEKRLLGRALVATKGNVRRAAQLLKIGRATLYRKIQIYDLPLR